MFSTSRRLPGVASSDTVEIEQSRYSFRLDSRKYSYSFVRAGEMIASPTIGEMEHYGGMYYFDETAKEVRYDASRGTPVTSPEDQRWKGAQAPEVPRLMCRLMDN